MLIKAAMASERMPDVFSNKQTRVEYLWFLFDRAGVFTLDRACATRF